MSRAGIRVWIDGGWCVDSLVGTQTRDHDDLDVAVDRDDVDELVAVLTDVGYRHSANPESTDWNFVMTDDFGHNVECITAEVMLQSKTAYPPAEKDQSDIQRLRDLIGR
jgi:lincosamide nucleotidyltransferase A/C/D/E